MACVISSCCVSCGNGQPRAETFCEMTDPEHVRTDNWAMNERFSSGVDSEISSLRVGERSMPTRVTSESS